MFQELTVEPYIVICYKYMKCNFIMTIGFLALYLSANFVSRNYQSIQRIVSQGRDNSKTNGTRRS